MRSPDHSSQIETTWLAALQDPMRWRGFHLAALPSIVQTLEYGVGIIEESAPGEYSPAQKEAMAAARMERKLHILGRCPAILPVIGQLTLSHKLVGAAELRAILDVADRPNVQLRVLPAESDITTPEAMTYVEDSGGRPHILNEDSDSLSRRVVTTLVTPDNNPLLFAEYAANLGNGTGAAMNPEASRQIISDLLDAHAG